MKKDPLLFLKVATLGAGMMSVKVIIPHAVGLTLVPAICGTIVIAYIVKAVVGLRPSEEMATAGLDLAEHGEEGYHG